MPLNAKGVKLLTKFKQRYGKDKGKKVFYASENKGSIKNVTVRREK